MQRRSLTSRSIRRRSVARSSSEPARMPKFLKIPLAALLLLVAAGCFLETMDASFATAAEARAAGYVAKGWIPPWLPGDATDVREVHDLDTNVSELSFAIPARDSLELPPECKPVEYSGTVRAYIRRHWWPGETELQQSYVFFRCPADAADYVFVSVSKAGTRVLHWRTYAR